MGNFRFYQDCKVTCWERDYFTVEADNYEEAEAIVRSWKCDDVTNITDKRLHLERNEVLRDTSERMFLTRMVVAPLWRYIMLMVRLL